MDHEGNGVALMKSIHHAGKALAMSMRNPIDNPDRSVNKNVHLTVHDKEHPDHQEYMDNFKRDYRDRRSK